jgi:glutathione S-transferase
MSTDKPTVILFGFPNYPNAPSGACYCQKVEAFLRFTSTPYELRATSPGKAPKGKLPYAEIYHPKSTNPTPEIVPDSHFIIRHLISQGISDDPDLSAGLTAVQRAESRAWQAYIEEVMYPSVVYEQWCIDKNYTTLVSEAFGKIPSLLRPVIAWFIRRHIRSGLWGKGIGRHSVAEVETLQKEAVEALETRLEGRVYFHGDEKPSGIDLILVSFLQSGLVTEWNPHWIGLFLKSPNLVAFAKRLTKSLFPEYEVMLGKLEDAEARLGTM